MLGILNFIYRFLMKKKLTHIFSCLSYVPFLSYVPLRQNFKSLCAKYLKKYLIQTFIFGILIVTGVDHLINLLELYLKF